MDNCRSTGLNFTTESSQQGYFITSIVILLVTAVYIPACLLYFYFNRNKDQLLRRRNFFLLLMFSLGCLLHNTNISVRGIVGGSKHSCHFYILSGIFSSMLILYTQVVRIWSLFWRVRFNKTLIDETFEALSTGKIDLKLGKEVFISNKEAVRSDMDIARAMTEIGESGRNRKTKILPGQRALFLKPLLFKLLRWKSSRSLPEELQFQEFLASKRFASSFFLFVFLIGVIISLPIHFSRFKVSSSCEGCTLDDFLYFSIFYFVSAAIFSIYGLLVLRKEPDALKIKNEIIVLLISFLVINFIFVLPLDTFVPDIVEDGKFDFSLISCVQLLLVFTYLTFYKVWSLKRRSNNENAEFILSLDDILQSEEGLKSFSLYLASRLSLENLLFYIQAKTFQKHFSEFTSDEINRKATKIHKVCLDQTSSFAVNLPYALRKQLDERLIAEEVDEHHFDEALKAVFDLMEDCFDDFLKTRYFRAYKKDIIEIKENSSDESLI